MTVLKTWYTFFQVDEEERREMVLAAAPKCLRKRGDTQPRSITEGLSYQITREEWIQKLQYVLQPFYGDMMLQAKMTFPDDPILLEHWLEHVYPDIERQFYPAHHEEEHVFIIKPPERVMPKGFFDSVFGKEEGFLLSEKALVFTDQQRISLEQITTFHTQFRHRKRIYELSVVYQENNTTTMRKMLGGEHRICELQEALNRFLAIYRKFHHRVQD